MNSIQRLSRELIQLHECLDIQDFWRYVGGMLLRSASIVRNRNLTPADYAMTGMVSVHVWGKTILVPLDAINRVLCGYDPTPTFGSIREIYASNVYLRAFRPDLRVATVFDLGSNRGMFLMLAAELLEASLAIGVEPQGFYERAFIELLEANRASKTKECKFVRLVKLASATNGSDCVTMNELLDRYVLSSIGFLKCDIEGREFDVFLHNNGFLEHTENISMELHPAAGDVVLLMETIASHGFRVDITDQFGRTVDPQRGSYLYASRSDALIAVSPVRSTARSIGAK